MDFKKSQIWNNRKSSNPSSSNSESSASGRRKRMVIDVTNDRNDSVNKKLRFPIRQLELRQVDDLNSDLELNEEVSAKAAAEIERWKTQTVKPRRSTFQETFQSRSQVTVIIPSSSFRNHNLLPSTLQNLTGPLVRVVNNIDDVSLPSNFEFINESIIGDGVETVDRAFMYGCDCKGPDNCEEEACSCFLQAEESDDDELPFPYAKSRRNRGCLRNFYLENRHHICECNERCSCSASCMNKVIQRGRQIPLEIFRTRNRGWGLRCPIILRKGDFIDTYRGEVITNEEADRRGKERARECNYLMDLDKFTSDEMLQIAEIKNTVTAEQFERLKRMVECGAHQSSMENGCELWKNPNYEPPYVCDGKNKGGPTRFINHSCEPNCLLLTASFNHADKRVYALAFFAKQDIPEGEEITFDYNVEEQEIMSDEMADKLEKERGYRPARCLCGTPTCRRYFFT